MRLITCHDADVALSQPSSSLQMPAHGPLMLIRGEPSLQIWQSWLVPATAADLEHQRAHRAAALSADDHTHDHAHEHGHGHGHDQGHDHGDHVHEERAIVEQNAVDAEGDAPERSRLTQAFIKVRFGCRPGPEQHTSSTLR